MKYTSQIFIKATWDWLSFFSLPHWARVPVSLCPFVIQFLSQGWSFTPRKQLKQWNGSKNTNESKQINNLSMLFLTYYWLKCLLNRWSLWMFIRKEFNCLAWFLSTKTVGWIHLYSETRKNVSFCLCAVNQDGENYCPMLGGTTSLWVWVQYDWLCHEEFVCEINTLCKNWLKTVGKNDYDIKYLSICM